MEILMASAELGPYAVASAAAGTVAALSKSLRQLGHDVTVVVPRYPSFEESGLLMARRLTPIEPPGGCSITVFDGQLSSGVKLVLLDLPGLLDRPDVFAAPDSPEGDAERFGVFAQGVVGLLRQRGKQGRAEDVVHLHDWPGALVPIALRAAPGATPPCVLTIHDVTRRGEFGTEALDALGVPKDLRGDDGVMLDERVNVLKGGILHADRVTTVSSTYSLEMRTKQRSGPLAEVLLSRVDEIVGINNGIDYSLYNPSTDAALAKRYDAEDSSAKGVCKTALVREVDLPIEPGWPLLVAADRWVEERGIDCIADALGAVLKNDVTVVLAGAGDAKHAAALRRVKKTFPDQVALVEEPDEGFLRRLHSAADISLLCPRHEPCGVRQLIAQRYGAIPVAHATGGLRDTIVDCDAQLETGTGFLFGSASPDALVGAVRRALAAYRSEAWPGLRRRVMRLDLGWDRPARRYAQIYRDVAAQS